MWDCLFLHFKQLQQLLSAEFSLRLKNYEYFAKQLVLQPTCLNGRKK